TDAHRHGPVPRRHYMNGRVPGRKDIGTAGNGNPPARRTFRRGFESLRARAIDRRQLRNGVTSRRPGPLAGPGRPFPRHMTRGELAMAGPNGSPREALTFDDV